MIILALYAWLLRWAGTVLNIARVVATLLRCSKSCRRHVWLAYLGWRVPTQLSRAACRTNMGFEASRMEEKVRGWGRRCSSGAPGALNHPFCRWDRNKPRSCNPLQRTIARCSRLWWV